MKLLKILIAYIYYFLSPKTLMRRSFIGTLLHFNIRLPNEVVNEIINDIYDVYTKNAKIDKVMGRGGININMERMLDLIQYRAFFIKDLLSNTHVNMSGQEAVLDILKKYKIYNEDEQSSTSSKILYFKDNEGAFEVAATINHPIFSEKSMCIGIVRYIDPLENSGILIELAGANEPLHVMGFNDKYAKSIKHGDLVYWGFVDYSDENFLNIKAVGHILAILKPEFNPQTKKWGIKKDITK